MDIDELAREAIATPEALGNKVLYNLCTEHPLHNEADIVGAKIWLIGRAYAAAIERRKKYRGEPNDDFYKNRVIPTILGSKIDERLDSLNKYTSVTEENIPKILEVHKYLLDIFREISGLEKRSLSSKYLTLPFSSSVLHIRLTSKQCFEEDFQ